MLKRSFMSAFIAALLCALLTACAPAAPKDEAIYYLVRHAEKVSGERDPSLTQAGEARALALVVRLAQANINQVYSTDYKRTRETAAPMAHAFGLEVSLYDPRDMAGFAEQLKTQNGNIVIVGHSNTTPGLAALLGIDPGEPIVEVSEYDRLYVIKRVGENVTGMQVHYGE
ncbi:MAG: phosphoglycerate mutase family protein [Robiginitomaculum sp.]